jgi:hypothetical protein
MEAPLDLEDEELLLLEPLRRTLPSSLVEEQGREPPSLIGFVEMTRSAGEGERVLVVLPRERVHRVPAVSVQIVALGPRDQEGVETGSVDQRAHRVHARPTVGAHGGEEREADAELIEQRAADRGELRLIGFELGPPEHASTMPHAR